MDKIKLLVIFILTISFLGAMDYDSKGRELYAADRIKVKVHEDVVQKLNISFGAKHKVSEIGVHSFDQLNNKYKVEAIQRAHRPVDDKIWEKQTGFDRWYLLHVPKSTDIKKMVNDYKKNKYVEDATVEYRKYLSITPNDPYFDDNWGHNNTSTNGPGSGHLVGFDAHIQEAWEDVQGYGSSDVIIAIIDTGTDYNHEDLSANCVAGYDYGDNDSNPMDDSASPGHGTCCAGVSAGITDNSIGVSGVAGGSRIMPLKIADSDGYLYDSYINNALTHCGDNNVDIASMSFGSDTDYGDSPTSDAAVEYAYNNGVTLLAATANDDYSHIHNPANDPNVIAVGAASPAGERKSATSADGQDWWGSNYGVDIQDARNAVDIIAPTILPATDISGTAGYSTGDYITNFNGTSCATPYAAGVAALIKSKFPEITNDEIREIMRHTAIDVIDEEQTPGWDRYTGYGLVNAEDALGGGLICNIINPVNGESFESNESVVIQAEAIVINGSISSLELFINDILVATESGNSIEYTWTDLPIGEHTIRAIATDNNTNEKVEEIIVTVTPPRTTIFQDDFESSSGWNLSGEFEINSPSGNGGENYGNPDPGSAYSGLLVLGSDLTGAGANLYDYEPNLSESEYTAVSPWIDCSGFSNVHLNFQRWLNVEQPTYDEAKIFINDGNTTTEIWSNSSTISDNEWSLFDLDISQWADDSENIQILFTLGPTDSAWQYSGWNIDDFEIDGIDNNEPSITLINPNGNEIIAPEQNYTINWQSSQVESNVKIELYQNDNIHSTLSTNTPNDGAYNWFVANTIPYSDDYKIKITSLADNNIFDFSDAYFSIEGVEIGVSTTSIDFGDETIGVTSDAEPFSITNQGSGTLTGNIYFPAEISIVRLSRAKQNRFASSRSELSFSIQSGMTQDYEVHFNPQVTGEYNSIFVITSNDEITPTVNVNLTANVLQPPAISVDPEVITVALTEGENDSTAVTIANSGESDLDYTLSIENDSRSMAGPDAFGYYWLDSGEINGPTYEWEEINIVGTALTLSDDSSTLIDLPFSFEFYGDVKNSVYISSNGYLVFNDNGDIYSNSELLDPEIPNDIICPFWDDLMPIGDDLGSVYYYHDIAGEKFIIQYDNVSHYSGDSTPLNNETFQVILYANGDILFQYAEVADNGDVTVGIENIDGTVGLQITDQTMIASEKAILFTNDIQNDNWLTLSSSNGSVLPNDNVQLNAYITALGVDPGMHTKNIVVSSNDPENSEIIVPVTLTVTEPSGPQIYLSTNQLNFGEVIIDESKALSFTIANTGEQYLNGTITVSGNFVVSVSSVATLARRDVARNSFSRSRTGRNEISFSIAGNSEKVIDVEFTPSELGNYQQQIIISHNAGEDETVQLYGEGVPHPAPEIDVSPLTISEQLTQNSTSVRNVTIQNSGNADLTFSALLQSASSRALLISENFENGIPVSWSVQDGSADSYTWNGVDYYGTSSSLDGTPFAFVDSDAAGSGIPFDESLISPSLNLSNYENIVLEFDQYFRYIAGYGDEKAEVDVWDGTSWVNVFANSSASVGGWNSPNHQAITIDNSLANSDFKVRFRYYDADYDYFWAIDNVEIYATSDNPEWIAIQGDGEGVIAENEEVDISLVFDSNNMAIGDYQAYLSIFSNDNDETEVVVPISLSVNEANNEPAWTVTSYENPFVTVNGLVVLQGLAATETDIVGVFSGEECRAIANPEISLGESLVNLQINSSGTNETFTIKIYDRSKDEVLVVPVELYASSGNSFGSSQNPYVISYGNLKSPERLEIVASEDNILLSWAEVYGATYYRIERSENPSSGFVNIGSSPNNSYLDNNGNSRKYFYRVIAVDSND